MNGALYHKAIVDKARSPATWPLPGASGAARTDNPLCGDRVDMAMRLEGGVVQAVGYRVRGCLLCEASAAIIAERAPGLDATALRAIAAGVAPMLSEGALPPWPDLAMFEPVRAHKSRWECVALPFRALVEALDAADAGYTATYDIR